MSKELPKTYNPADFEDAIYEKWEKSGFFNPNNLKGEPYSIMMPPPNVTGVLHLGHALENSLMDIMARYQRMNGKKVLLLPGTDHAAVATQAKVEKILIESGKKNPRQELGREKLLEKIREYAEESKSTILKQIKKMGTSCDWSRLAYTFDETRNQAVNEIFVKMHNDGLIYRGHRAVNWSVKGQSTCSDDELVHVERLTKLYTIRYAKDFPILIATTQPETKLGDTAVAVNPKDKRYKKYIGQTFTVEVGAAKPLTIKIIVDENVDEKFGTGAIGVTPAHSLVDFEMYEKQKAKGEPIGLIQVIGQDGKMTEAAGKEYQGLSTLEAREKFVNWLKKEKLVEKEEEIKQNVGTSDRFGDVVEVLPMTQWFLDVNKVIPGKKKSLKDLMREAVTTGHNGDKKQKVIITPERFEKIYLHWIDNLRDWCISRQIWWGHRIPVWYKEKPKVESERLKVKNQEIYVGTAAPVNPNFIFLHGFYRTRDVKDPLNWLNKKLPHQDNFWQVLPNPDEPNREEQEKFVLENAKINRNSIIVTHSLGSALALKIIQDKNLKIKKLVMLAPSLGTPTVELKEYKNFKVDFKKIKKNVGEIIIFQASKDRPGKEEEIAEIAALLNAKIIKVENSASHFNSDECREVLDELKKDYWTQDEDTLDTWFSSGLWTFSTLGWPNKSPLPPPIKGGNKDLKTFHPTSWMQMGYEILFFWMARMILMSTYALDQIPFKDVYIHGMLRNELGKKFSKSSGNNIDPLEIIKKYGTDALRLSVIAGIAPGNDSKFYEEKVEGARNMVNKLWNVARYIMTSQRSESQNQKLNEKNLTLADRWILGKMDNLIKIVTEDLENYEFSQAGERLRVFGWDNLADWYLEACKFEKNKEKEQILYYILENLLKLWHPFMPFMTEALWQELGQKNLLMVEKWPACVKALAGKSTGEFELVKEIIIAIRNARAENKVEPAKKVKAVIYAGKNKKLIEAQAELIKGLRTGINELEITEDKSPLDSPRGEINTFAKGGNAGAIYATVGDIEIYLLGAVDAEKEKARIEKEIANLEKIITSAEVRLANKEFTEKAPAAIVKKEKEKLKGWQAELKNLKSS